MTAPQPGDRVTVTLTGTVVRGYGGPVVHVELDSDYVSTHTICAVCDPDVDCTDDRHPVRDQVLAFVLPEEVFAVERGGVTR